MSKRRVLINFPESEKHRLMELLVAAGAVNEDQTEGSLDPYASARGFGAATTLQIAKEMQALGLLVISTVIPGQTSGKRWINFCKADKIVWRGVNRKIVKSYIERAADRMAKGK